MKDITQLPAKFYITYFAKKHNAFITRKASATNPEGTEGKMFTDKNGTDRFIYWDFDSINKKTQEFGDWRHATSQWTIKEVA